MEILLLDSNAGTPFWTIFSAIGTFLAAGAAIVYTFYTARLLNQTTKAATASSTAATASALAATASADAAKATAEGVKQNAISNELSAYLALKKDLLTDIFIQTTTFCSQNMILVDDRNEVSKGFEVLEDGNLKINQMTLVKDVLNDIEEVAMFYEREVMTLRTIDAAFGYAILNIGNCGVIRDKIKTWQQSGEEVFDGFSTLYSKLYNGLSISEKTKYKPNLLD